MQRTFHWPTLVGEVIHYTPVKRTVIVRTSTEEGFTCAHVPEGIDVSLKCEVELIGGDTKMESVRYIVASAKEDACSSSDLDQWTKIARCAVDTATIGDDSETTEEGKQSSDDASSDAAGPEAIAARRMSQGDFPACDEPCGVFDWFVRQWVAYEAENLDGF